MSIGSPRTPKKFGTDITNDRLMKRVFTNNDLNIRFCPEEEINQKREKILLMKA